MGKFFGRLLFWIIVVGVFWLAGDRYGAPGWLTNITDRGFQALETVVSSLTGQVFDADEGHASSDRDSEAAKLPAPAPAASTANTGGVAQNAGLRINQAGLEIIKMSEGLRLEAYSSGGRRYIGYGHQLQAGDPTTITQAQAEALLRQDVKSAEDGVRRLLTRPATENQFSAMVSLAYNLGLGAFGRSFVPAKFNEGDLQGAADAFLNHNKGGGQVLDHLIERRTRERALFLSR
ncbi:lysozyme [Parvularcula sp. IMCC14364]|uniref:lysozyme n=1 Tax=Parvularcula sp. IMCC14364 TaxID=3067902 RepID=UPI00274219B9|nr:lysozyme [Parvularcula sp. IMCC14364]